MLLQCSFVCSANGVCCSFYTSRLSLQVGDNWWKLFNCTQHLLVKCSSALCVNVSVCSFVCSLACSLTCTFMHSYVCSFRSSLIDSFAFVAFSDESQHQVRPSFDKKALKHISCRNVGTKFDKVTLYHVEHLLICNWMCL